ncbi:HNH endonuclease signature motif containing protein [Pseudomonas sp. GT1P32]
MTSNETRSKANNTPANHSSVDVASIKYRLVRDETEAASEFDFEGEIARTLLEYPGYASVRDGRVLSLKGKKIKILKPGKAGDYRFVNLYRKGHPPSTLTHRFHARAHIPNPERKPQVNHKDGRPWNNCVSNLEWVTQPENVKHANALRRSEGRKLMKLSFEQRLLVAELNMLGFSIAQMERASGLPRQSVRNVLDGMTRFSPPL